MGIFPRIVEAQKPVSEQVFYPAHGASVSVGGANVSPFPLHESGSADVVIPHLTNNFFTRKRECLVSAGLESAWMAVANTMPQVLHALRAMGVELGVTALLLYRGDRDIVVRGESP